MYLLDVNILVQAHREDADKHQSISAWLQSAMAEPAGVGVSELVLSGCLRIITHGKIFTRPTPVKTALEFVHDFRNRDEVTLISPGSAHWEIFYGLCKRMSLRGNQIPDAYHAALAIETGCQWASLDWGFRAFPGLKCYHPIDHR